MLSCTGELSIYGSEKQVKSLYVDLSLGQCVKDIGYFFKKCHDLEYHGIFIKYSLGYETLKLNMFGSQGQSEGHIYKNVLFCPF